MKREILFNVPIICHSANLKKSISKTNLEEAETNLV